MPPVKVGLASGALVPRSELMVPTSELIVPTLELRVEMLELRSATAVGETNPVSASIAPLLVEPMLKTTADKLLSG